MEIKLNIKLDPIEISNHLLQLGDDFIDNLEKKVDREIYAAKLSEFSQMNAIFVDQDLVGLIAYYKNDEKNLIFISHVGVIPIWQNNGFASKLVNSVITESLGFTIQLEVFEENLFARKLYESLDFKISGIFESKLTMERFL